MKVLTVEEIASELRVTRGTVRRWIRQGRLKKLPLPGTIRVEEGEFQRFIKGGGEE